MEQRVPKGELWTRGGHVAHLDGYQTARPVNARMVASLVTRGTFSL